MWWREVGGTRGKNQGSVREKAAVDREHILVK